MTSESRGFSLIEVAVVLGILALITSIGLVVGLESFRHTRFNDDRDTLRLALMHARLEALYGLCAGDDCTAAAAHGVSAISSGYDVFEGATYASRDESEDELLDSFHSNPASAEGDIVFQSLSAEVLIPGNFLLKDGTWRSSTTSVLSEGAIMQTP